MGIGFAKDNKKRLEEGSHRIRPVEETLATIEPIAHKFGVTRVADVTGLDRVGIPVTLAIRPNSKSVAVSQGKGTTLAHAKASALMEAIEIWHAENFAKPILYGKKLNLQKSHRVIDTDRLPRIPNSAFTNATPCLWVSGTDLIWDAEILVPYEMIHADYTRPIQPMHGFFPASTNGLASGNSALEAVCHAITEVVERDALSLWHFTTKSERDKRRIDPGSINNAECNALLNQLAASHLEFGIWDITTDIRLPTIICIIRELDGNSGHMGLGSGCHAESSVALRRAITEAAQTRLNYISGARDDLHFDEYDPAGLEGKQLFAEKALKENLCPLQFSEIPSYCNPTLKEDLDLFLSCLKKIGIDEVAWVDLTQEEYGVSVARAIIPGLEAPHDDDNYVAGPRALKVAENG